MGPDLEKPNYIIWESLTVANLKQILMLIKQIRLTSLIVDWIKYHIKAGQHPRFLRLAPENSVFGTVWIFSSAGHFPCN